MSGPNIVKIEKTWCRIDVTTMVFKHWSESDPDKLQNRINEENSQFCKEYYTLLKVLEAGVEKVVTEWRKRHPCVKIVAWSSATHFIEWDEMMVGDGDFPKDTPFTLSMGFRLNRQTLNGSVFIGFKEKPTMDSYYDLKQKLTALFALVDEK
jgi:hypothetical protein